MIRSVPLSVLAQEITDAVEQRFAGRFYWITAEVSDVKKYVSARRCYLKIIERQNNNVIAEIRAVFWSNYYGQIENFERATRQEFRDGISVTCCVCVRYHPRYGLNLDVVQIDVAYTIGEQELERQRTLERLVRENSETIKCIDGRYVTRNNTMALPRVIQRIALVTAPNSDGQRDFMKELRHNKHGFAYHVQEYLTQVQGDQAHLLIMDQLRKIAVNASQFDAVAIVRGGGSQTDFKPFEDYSLAREAAAFPVPVFTGIGHDRNTGILDLMVREQKTPTKVAALFVEHNAEFETELLALRDYLKDRANRRLQAAEDALKTMARILRMANPEEVLKKGFALLRVNGRIVSDVAQIAVGTEIEAQMNDGAISAVVTGKSKK